MWFWVMLLVIVLYMVGCVIENGLKDVVEAIRELKE